MQTANLWARFKSVLPRIYFLLSVFFIVFVCGIAVGHYKIPPYGLLKRAMYAANDLWWWVELKLQENVSKHPHVIAVSDPRPGARIQPRLVSPGATAITLFFENRFGVILVDADGQVIHRWRIPEVVLDRLIAGETWSMDKSHYTIHGTHVFPNGDVVFNIEGTALLRIDRCSNLMWSLDEPVHHSVFVDADGEIWVPSKRTVTDRAEALPHMTLPYEEDLVLRVSSDGKILQTISILKAIYKGKYEGVVLEGGQDYPKTTELDPTHLNDVELIGREFASRHDFVNPGDLLVSLRTIDTVAIIDRGTHTMKWAMTGLFLRQHDPDALPDGNLLVFDNRTDKGQHNEAIYKTEPQDFGYSRIMEIDPKSQHLVWEYTGTRAAPFYTSIQGKQQWLPNGNVLITETEGGRVFEVTRDSKEIAWEFVNTLPGTEGRNLGRITEATRMPLSQLDFPGHKCSP